MGEVQGYVTRTLGAPRMGLLGLSAGVRPPVADNCFVASKRDGTVVGSYGSFGLARQALENTLGGHLLRWIREDQNGIENYRAESLTFWPVDLGDQLDGGAFWRADIGNRLVPANAPDIEPKRSLRWAARNDGTQVATAANLAAAPLFADAETITTATGRPSLRFSGGDAMATTLLAVTQPFTLFAVVTYDQAAPARREVIFERTDAGLYSLGVNIGGNWSMITPTGELAGPAASDGETAVLTLVQSTTGLEVFLNGVSFGTNATVPGAQDFCISSLASAADWEGDIYELLFLTRELNDSFTTMVMNYYFDYYGIARP